MRIPAVVYPTFGGQIPEAAYLVAENPALITRAADSPRPTG